jgi:hypothetical protein
MASCNILCGKFSELPQFDKGRRRIVEEIAFGKRTETREPLIVRCKEIEVAAYPPWAPK